LYRISVQIAHQNTICPKLVQFDFFYSKMVFTNKLNIRLAILVLSTFLFSCKSIAPIDEEIAAPIINQGIGAIPDSVKGLLVFHENFQKWKRDGYLLYNKQDCETDLMKSAGLVSFIPTDVKVIYDSLQIKYSLIDFAVNPECGNAEGSSMPTSEISTGYIALQCPILYTCGHYSKGDVITSPIPNVSYVEFTVSYGDNSKKNYAAGISLWKKGELDTDTVKVGTYIPSNPLKGEKFTVKLDSKNVVLKFKAEKNAGIPIKKETDFNISVRIHDIYIWKPNK